MAAQYAYDYMSNAAPDMMPQRAPQKRPQEKNRPDLHAVERPKVDSAAQQRASAAVVAKFLVLVVFSIACFGIICDSFADVRSEKLNYAENLKQLEIYKSQQVEVDAKLGTLVTPDKIAKIAVEKLGMVKLPDENKTYAYSSGENEIVVSREN